MGESKCRSYGYGHRDPSREAARVMQRWVQAFCAARACIQGTIESGVALSLAERVLFASVGPCPDGHAVYQTS